MTVLAQEAQKDQTSQGIQLVTREMPYTDSVAFSAWLSAGSRDEPAAKPGLAHFTEHLWGTEYVGDSSLTARKEMKSYTGKEFTMSSVRVPKSAFQGIFSQFAKAITSPNLSDTRLQFERYRILRELQETQRIGFLWSSVLLEQMIWGHHALGRPTIGYRESINAITAEDIDDYVKATALKPARVVVSIAGAIQHHEALTSCEEAFGGLTIDPVFERDLYEEDQDELVIDSIEEDMPQHIAIGFKGFPRRDSQFGSLTILADFFNHQLRRIGPTKSPYQDLLVQVRGYQETGLLLVILQIADGRAVEALTKVTRFIRDLKEGSIDQNQFLEVKNFNRDKLILSKDSVKYTSGWYGETELYSLEPNTLEEQIGAIEDIELIDIMGTANDVLRSDKTTVGVIGRGEADLDINELKSIAMGL